MGTRTVFFTIIFLAVSLFSCGSASDTEHISESKEKLNRILVKWNSYKEANRQDSILISAKEYYEESVRKNDTLGVQFAGIHMAQAYILTDADYDTTSNFLENLKPYFSGNVLTQIAIIYYNVMGHWKLKYELDYSEALNYYMKVFDCSKRICDINNQIVALSNIVNIFYVRSDEHGKAYADEALLLSENDSVEVFNKVAANVAMAQICYLSENIESALNYLDKATGMLDHGNIRQYWSPIISLLYGDVFNMSGDVSEAERYYVAALEHSEHSEPATVTLIYLKYGDYCRKSGKVNKAIELYERGLALSEVTNNMEFRTELLKNLASLLYETGDRYRAASFYREYVTFSDSLFLESKNQNFSNTLLSYSEMEHKYEIARLNLQLSENRQRLIVIISVSVLVLLVAAVISIMYARQKKVYKGLVKRYNEFSRRLTSETRKQNAILDSGTLQNQNAIYEKLYLEMEKLMSEGIFRQKNLSLEKMAEMLGSNRTYVSNTVNKMANTSFYNYVNTYRIREAVRILSEQTDDSDISLKYVADYVGYNSVQVFHRAFKEETGVTPGIFKAEMQKKGN